MGWSTSRPDRFAPEKELWFPLNMSLNGLQSPSGILEKRKTYGHPPT